jgi:hypothetical protein
MDHYEHSMGFLRDIRDGKRTFFLGAIVVWMVAGGAFGIL